MSDPTPPSDTEATSVEALAESVWRFDKAASVHGIGFGETFAEEPVRDTYRAIAGMLLASDWLAADRAVQRAEGWDEGYAKCSDDFERHLNHAPLFDCDCPEDPLLANPHRSGAQC